jgi:hypothetical protein
MQAFKMTDRRWDDDIQDLVHLLRKAAPELRVESSRDRLGAEASPAQVLRELGERVLEEVIHHRDGSSQSENSRNHHQPRLLVGFGRYMKKIFMSFVLVAAMYIGLRLFGDDELLQKLDQMEALLLVGWERLMTYVKGLR